MKIRWAALIGLMITIGMIYAGCGDTYETAAMQTVSNEDGETLTLTASPDNLNIAAGGSITIQVMLSNYEGEPLEGSKVYLTSTMGALAENVLATDSTGTAITILNSGDIEGWAVVVATFGTIQAMVKISMYYDGSNDASGGDGSGFEDGADDGTGDTTGDAAGDQA